MTTNTFYKLTNTVFEEGDINEIIESDKEYLYLAICHDGSQEQGFFKLTMSYISPLEIEVQARTIAEAISKALTIANRKFAKIIKIKELDSFDKDLQRLLQLEQLKNLKGRK